jgi:hypothetical protein
VGENGLKRLIGAKRYREALDLILDEGEQYPELARMLTYERTFLLAKLGDAPQALSVLADALAAGVYHPAMVLASQEGEGSPRTFAELDGLPEFERLRAAHQERYWTSMESAPPVLTVVHPENPPAAPPSLLFAVHGNNSNIENEIDHYRPVTGWGWTLAMPQSAQPCDIEGCYIWGDWSVTERQLAECWDLLGPQLAADPHRVVTAGLSKGGEDGVWLAMSSKVQACGFIAIAPGGPLISKTEGLLPFVEAARASGLRGYLIVGQEDQYCYESTVNYHRQRRWLVMTHLEGAILLH